MEREREEKRMREAGIDPSAPAARVAAERDSGGRDRGARREGRPVRWGGTGSVSVVHPGAYACSARTPKCFLRQGPLACLVPVLAVLAANASANCFAVWTMPADLAGASVVAALRQGLDGH